MRPLMWVGVMAAVGCAPRAEPAPATSVNVQGESGGTEGEAEPASVATVTVPATPPPPQTQAQDVPSDTAVPTTVQLPPSVPSIPSRQDVADAMRQAAPNVQRCGNGTASVVTVRLEFDSTGRVTSAQSNAPPDIDACVRSKVSSARVPPFTRPTFRVSYPFRMH